MTSAASDGSTIRTPVMAAIAVVRSPEMQAIRTFIMDRWHVDVWSYGSVQQHMRDAGLPESVVQWVLPDAERPWLQP